MITSLIEKHFVLNATPHCEMATHEETNFKFSVEIFYLAHSSVIIFIFFVCICSISHLHNQNK